jgi:arylsulfatase
VHEGGVADPCIIRWPNGIAARGAVREQYAHAIDVLPTVLDLVGIDPPARIAEVEQSPIEGASFASVLRDADSPPTRTTQYFEMLGSRAIYHDGWKAVTFKPLGALYDDGIDPDAPFSEDRWELYHVAEDFSERYDLAEAEPERLAELVELWWQEARSHNVLPLDNRPLAALLDPRPSRARDRSRYQYFPDAAPVPESMGANVRNRSHSMTVDVHVPADATFEGVLLAQGSVLGGWTFFAQDGHLTYEHNVAGKVRHRVESDVRVPSGRQRVGFEFERTADFAGVGRLYIGSDLVGEAEIPFTTPARFSITGAGLSCGYEVGPAVSPSYVAPFRCTGGIVRAFIDVSGAPYVDVKAELEATLIAQ